MHKTPVGHLDGRCGGCHRRVHSVSSMKGLYALSLSYHDTGGVLTAYYGHTRQDVISSKHYADAECRLLLNSDLSGALSIVDRSVTASLIESQKAALASFICNIGSGAFARSTLLKKLNSDAVRRDYFTLREL
ncbi:MAG TPA: glycoside hydrolase family protein [Arsenophonus apicola]